MMLSLGDFRFEIRTAAYQQWQRSTRQRWAEGSRVGARPAYQNVGPGEDTLTLNGTIYPEIAPGSQVTLDVLRVMMEADEPHILVSGDGYVHGDWGITAVDETQSEFYPDGAARKIEFTLNLTRVDDAAQQLRSGVTAAGLRGGNRVVGTA